VPPLSAAAWFGAKVYTWRSSNADQGVVASDKLFTDDRSSKIEVRHPTSADMVVQHEQLTQRGRNAARSKSMERWRRWPRPAAAQAVILNVSPLSSSLPGRLGADHRTEGIGDVTGNCRRRSSSLRSALNASWLRGRSAPLKFPLIPQRPAPMASTELAVPPANTNCGLRAAGHVGRPEATAASIGDQNDVRTWCGFAWWISTASTLVP